MIGIAQANLRPDIVGQFVLMHRFDRACRADRHKNRRFDASVRGFDQSGAGPRAVVAVLQGEFHEKTA